MYHSLRTTSKQYFGTWSIIVCICGLILLCNIDATAQYVYKTPYGKKYHTYTCHSVKNVSEKISLKKAVTEHGLAPCKRCKPPVSSDRRSKFDNRNKAVGECTKVRCTGWAKTQKRRCKRSTKMCNGLCFQHQNPNRA
jgi:methylphosphotriester-DNA--protein-cysteine methyltransferase